MRPSILIAEDDALQSALMLNALEERGYQAESVPNGLEAIRRLRAQHYDVALLDYQMPDVDGLAAARLLRDLMPHGERPRLIAITAAEEGLSSRGKVGGDAAFDAIVSKSSGLPALLTIIDANLSSAAEINAAAMRREAGHVEILARRRHRRAVIASIPALAVAASCLVAFVVGLASLRHLDHLVLSTERVQALSADTTALVSAVQSAEMSERSFLATGSPIEKEQFAVDAQRVDRMLDAATSLSADGMPGAEISLQNLIEAKMKSLADEALHWRTSTVTKGGLELSGEVGHDADGPLRDWASAVSVTAQRAVLNGLAGIRQNVLLVLAALAVATGYGLWSTVAAMRRKLCESPIASIGMSTASGSALPLSLSAPVLVIADNAS